MCFVRSDGVITSLFRKGGETNWKVPITCARYVAHASSKLGVAPHAMYRSLALVACRNQLPTAHALLLARPSPRQLPQYRRYLVMSRTCDTSELEALIATSLPERCSRRVSVGRPLSFPLELPMRSVGNSSCKYLFPRVLHLDPDAACRPEEGVRCCPSLPHCCRRIYWGRLHTPNPSPPLR